MTAICRFVQSDGVFVQATVHVKATSEKCDVEPQRVFPGASVGSTEASENVPARVGVVGRMSLA
jgi:hypothetical protein